MAILDLVRYSVEGELPYRPYSDVLYLHENRHNMRMQRVLWLLFRPPRLQTWG